MLLGLCRRGRLLYWTHLIGLASRSLLSVSPDLMRFGLLVLRHSGGDVGNYFTDISNSFRPTFTEYQSLAFLQKLWMFDKSESFHMKSDDQLICTKSGYLNKT